MSVLTVMVIGLLSGSLIVYMRTSPRFEITRIGVRGTSRLTPESIVEHLAIQPHTNIFQVQLADVEQQLEALQWIKEAQVFRNFPDKLSINLTERTPCALIKLEQLHLVDREGVLLGALASGSAITLPIITGDFVSSIDRNGDNLALQQALEAIIAFSQSALPLFQDIRKIRVQSLANATFFSHDSLPEVRVPLVDYTQKLRDLSQLYPSLEIEQLAYIDLRFDRRIIVKPNKS